MKKISLALAVITLSLSIGCKSQKETATNTPQKNERPEMGERGERPDPFLMDINDDGKLTKLEVTGKLLEDFDLLDVDGDNYLTKEELGIKDKPAGERPEGGRPGGGGGRGQGGHQR